MFDRTISKPSADFASASESQTEAKNDFNDIYNRPDPRPYYRSLLPLRYQAPGQATDIFERCIGVIRKRKKRRDVTVLDLACGYGINAALLNYDVTLDDLYARYTGGAMDELDPEGVIAEDTRFFKARRKPLNCVRTIGQDVADRALAYATRVGILDEAINVDLESGGPTAEQARLIGEADLLTVTGGFSYISAATFRRILDCFPVDQRPWIVGFPLLATETQGFVNALSGFGLKVQRAEGHLLPHRVYADDEERDGFHARYREEGWTVEGTPLEEWLCAEPYIARPVEDTHRPPLGMLLTDREFEDGLDEDLDENLDDDVDDDPDDEEEIRAKNPCAARHRADASPAGSPG